MAACRKRKNSTKKKKSKKKKTMWKTTGIVVKLYEGNTHTHTLTNKYKKI